MTKQEELREGIATALYWNVPTPQSRDWSLETVELRNVYLSKADAVIRYLHSQGVVIKVDRELPHLLSKEIYDKKEMEIAIKQAGIMIEVGYEPLIKE